MKPTGGRLLTLVEAAGLLEEPVWRFRRRLAHWNERSGGTLVSTTHGQRGHGCKLWISATALLTVLRSDPTQRDEDTQRLKLQLEALERRVQSVDSVGRKTRRELRDFKNRQENVNRASAAAIEAVRAYVQAVRNDGV